MGMDPLTLSMDIEVFLVSGVLLVRLDALTTWTGRDVCKALHPHIDRGESIGQLSVLQSGTPVGDADQLKDVLLLELASDAQYLTVNHAKQTLQLQMVLASTATFVLRIHPYWCGSGPLPSRSFFIPEVRRVNVELEDCVVSVVTDLVADTYKPGPATMFHPPTQIRVFTEFISPSANARRGPLEEGLAPQTSSDSEAPQTLDDPGPSNSEWQASHRVASDANFADLDERTLEVFLIEAWDGDGLENNEHWGLYRART